MTAIMVELTTRPPSSPTGRPESTTVLATNEIIPVANVDDLFEGNDCSCTGSDDNPH
ncbi:hypothetical protein [Streptomyces violascens]|uniref:Uncharacterized protein n=1 Tax=Streptomyces violascens TaxID=67381 RepID=A0ABQ3QL50_9ACTN|nr:hypothetical protein [Streptomyces violascens]GGU44464.1 hypothetical protein GCM10010289_76300 [Streptomyces violascens]GHI38001.1 hypothetical protein Sviol_24090 [Streptomyces violascens]